jgi:hypothetical protein
MKTRMCFVANSSSSSFVCAICGESYEGWDISPSDCECSTCVNGHIICNEHKISDDEENEDGEVPETACPICQFQDYDNCEMAKYLEKTRSITRDEVFESVKAINKCRKKLHDEEYVTFVCKKFELNDDMLLEEVRSKFKTFREFGKFIGEKYYD